MKNSEENTSSIEVKKKVYQGYGLAEWNNQALFVEHGVPGDVITAKITLKKKNYSFAKIKKLIKKSPGRTYPECISFGRCGGCDWLNIDYKYQLEYKQSILDEFFKSIESDVLPVDECKKRDHYRNKCFYPLSKKDNRPVYGMFAKNSHQVITHDECKLQPAIFDKLAEAFCDYIIKTKETIYNERSGIGNIRHIGFRIDDETGKILVIVVTAKRRIAFSKQLVRTLNSVTNDIYGVIQNINPTKGNVIMGQDFKILEGESHLMMHLAGKKFKLHYNSFFQVNTSTAEAMINFTKTFIDNDDVIIDAFCGAGSIGICLAEKAKRVIGIENVATSVINAKNNAKLNKLNNCVFLKGDVSKLLEEIIVKEKPNKIIFDPPRKGLDDKIIDIVAEAEIPRVIYISCNPSTQLRDVKIFMEKGYKLAVRKGFDMFPHTWHIENIVILEK